MASGVSYRKEVQTVFLGSREITLTSLTPVFSDGEERKQTEERIEHSLYAIFQKYAP